MTDKTRIEHNESAFGLIATRKPPALAANAVLHNLVLIGSFFLDGMATAAEQLCGRSVGARDPRYP
jgi:Na+-driven multidrug efflux pump